MPSHPHEQCCFHYFFQNIVNFYDLSDHATLKVAHCHRQYIRLAVIHQCDCNESKCQQLQHCKVIHLVLT